MLAFFYCFGKGEVMADKELTDAQLRRLQNLGPYKGKTLDEIREAVLAKRSSGVTKRQSKAERAYEQRFDEKFQKLSQEFGVDLNNSNDVEALNNLVRLIIQGENVDDDIRSIQEQPNKNKDDVVVLKNLGDFQRNLNMSMDAIQEKLGISRKQRKEKSVDDIPQWIDNVLKNSKDFFNRKTQVVLCPKDDIELVRYWVNFPELLTTAEFSAECPHCGEIVRYNR